MQAWLSGSKFDGGLILRDCIRVAIGFRVSLRQYAMHQPGMRINFEHPGVAVLRYQQVRPATMIQNVLVVRLELGGAVERVGGLFCAVLGQTYDAQPHPGIRVPGRGDGFLLDGGASFVQMIEPEFRDSKKEVCPMKPRLQRQGLLEIRDRVFVSTLLLAK